MNDHSRSTEHPLSDVPRSLLNQRVLDWYSTAARSLPWREAGTSPWGILVSEFMLQQTPVVRVEPLFRAWMSRWPSPAALADSPSGEAIHAWGRLGYPRRALRLHAAAVAIVERHSGEVPRTYDELLALPGVGAYTASAVSAFAFGARATVLDTNVRRVLARVINGVAQAGPSPSRAETNVAAALLPETADAARWSVAVMELGALLCSARTPQCPLCPVQDLCAWQLAGRPAYEGPVRRGQPWLGTDRQCRGAILAVLRGSRTPVSATRVGAAWTIDDTQRDRCLEALVADGLVEPLPDNHFRLPGR
ncbi:MAG: A/G-specific adenine glycosylase [Actinomycetota bacterium]